MVLGKKIHMDIHMDIRYGYGYNYKYSYNYGYGYGYSSDDEKFIIKKLSIYTYFLR